MTHESSGASAGPRRAGSTLRCRWRAPRRIGSWSRSASRTTWTVASTNCAATGTAIRTTGRCTTTGTMSDQHPFENKMKRKLSSYAIGREVFLVPDDYETIKVTIEHTMAPILALRQRLAKARKVGQGEDRAGRAYLRGPGHARLGVQRRRGAQALPRCRRQRVAFALPALRREPRLHRAALRVY